MIIYPKPYSITKTLNPEFYLLKGDYKVLGFGFGICGLGLQGRAVSAGLGF